MEQFKFNPEKGRTILEPEGIGEGYWVGAPTIYFDNDVKKFYMYARIRNPRPTKGGVSPNDEHRGFKCLILETSNGIDFDVIWEMRKKQINVKSIEGGTLIKIHGKYHLFFSFESHSLIPRWQIRKITADHPSNLSPYNIKKVDWNLPLFHRLSIKDPIIVKFKEKFYLFIDYFRFWKTPWGSSALFTSVDGNKFKWKGDVFTNLKKCQWASHMIRLTSIFNHDNKYYGYFDGASRGSELCEEKAGICCGTILNKIKILSLEQPNYYSNYGKGSCRYIFALKHNNQLLIYYEFTEKKGEHVLKMMKI
ncbi:MAG: hypothetical protein ACTSRG_23320 [Candidatus Helarchaeota archaeon]